MGIDAAFLDRIAAIGAKQGLFPGATVAILGDCRFLTSWATGDNRADLGRFAQALGLARVETLDVMGDPTIRLDLHEPLPPELTRQFDVVIDAGTAHCCFDVAAVLKNCLDMLKPQGTIFHLSALTGFFGRAYYSFNPLLFRDFYLQNGFSLLAMEARVPSAGATMPRLLRRLYQIGGRKLGAFDDLLLNGLHLEQASALTMKFGSDMTRKPSTIPNDAVIMVAARREQASPFVRPVPSFFSARAAAPELAA